MADSFYDAFSPEEIARISAAGTRVHVPQGWSPIWERTPADKAYLILDGTVSVRQHGEEIAQVGKGAIVGEAGELEHGALWHVPGGYAMRELLGNAKAIVPSTKKVGGPGARLDVPVTHINASYVRGHFNAMEVGIADAPRADEIVLALVMTTGARIHERMGGLKASEIKGEDGLR